MKLLAKIGSLFSIVALSVLACLPLAAGPIPFTQDQFPVWRAVSPTPVSVTNTPEQTLYQVALPANVMGNSGYMKLIYTLDGDGINVAHTMRFYLGGPGFTNATALFTNTFTTTQNALMQASIFPYSGGYSNLVDSSTTTNYANPRLQQTIVVGSQTNGLYLTVTGSNTGTTNYLSLDNLTIEALSQY